MPTLFLYLSGKEQHALYHCVATQTGLDFLLPVVAPCFEVFSFVFFVSNHAYTLLIMHFTNFAFACFILIFPAALALPLGKPVSYDQRSHITSFHVSTRGNSPLTASSSIAPLQSTQQTEIKNNTLTVATNAYLAQETQQGEQKDPDAQSMVDTHNTIHDTKGPRAATGSSQPSSSPAANSASSGQTNSPRQSPPSKAVDGAGDLLGGVGQSLTDPLEDLNVGGLRIGDGGRFGGSATCDLREGCSH
ncbi:hypothetical protein DFH11DRAFT_805316 [Phellopilus nigrolimitatus]|nr:hypothetical protein DFH11DRAFT_805316 [Phellopilus nigrolimitatus]